MTERSGPERWGKNILSSSIFVSLVVLCALPGVPAEARDTSLYVAPAGQPGGKGTRSQPYDLATALSGSVGRPGDTFWLTGGTYRIGHIDTQVHGEAGRPITFRAVRGERAEVIGSLTLWGEAGYAVFRDLELSRGAARRVSSQRNAGFNPTDLPDTREGIQVYSPNCSFINMVVHDSVGSAFYTSEEATNTLLYGCIVYNSGWASADNAEGHSFYLQGSGEVAENLAFNSTGAGFHVYSNSKGAFVRYLTLEGNVAFGAGTLQSVRPYRDWIVGVDAPAQSAEQITLRHNMGYAISGPTTLSAVQLGREHLNGTVNVSSNYWPQGLVLAKWREVSFTGNVLAPRESDSAVELEQLGKGMNWRWDNNAYFCASSNSVFQVDARDCSFSEWTRWSGYDSGSSWVVGPLTGTRVFVRPNRFEPGRANIVVYNWGHSTNVTVDVCACLPLGLSYEVRNAEDWSAPAVARGKFDGKPLELPMTGLTVARPLGGLKTPAPTGPAFNVFVLLPAEQRAGSSETPKPKSETSSRAWQSESTATGTGKLAEAAYARIRPETNGLSNFEPSQP